jgi:hypothetical protein
MQTRAWRLGPAEILSPENGTRIMLRAVWRIYFPTRLYSNADKKTLFIISWSSSSQFEFTRVLHSCSHDASKEMGMDGLMLCQRELFWNINLGIICVISGSLQCLCSYTRARYGPGRGPHAFPSLSAKHMTEKTHFWMYLDYQVLDNAICVFKLFWPMDHTFLWQLYLHVLHSDKLAKSWSATSKLVTEL